MSCTGEITPALFPAFEVKVLERRSDGTELVQDATGRQVLYFQGRRHGFMPEYVAHPVQCERDFAEKIVPRLNLASPERLAAVQADAAKALPLARRGHGMIFNVIGGYMFLRSLVGPEALLYLFYDDPELIHTMMREWLKYTDWTAAQYQKTLVFDSILLDEDICYKQGPLISPEHIREFLFPYYQQLIANCRKRQLDPGRTLHIDLDTDGQAETVIALYQDGIGMDSMWPFEVASGCDVVEIGKRYPWLRMRAGFDKRVITAGPAAIDREIDRILPVMRQRGGYIPQCDHGVPPETPLKHYQHFIRRLREFGI